MPCMDLDSEFMEVMIRQAPLFGACAFGIVLAAIWCRRHALPAGLVFAGSLLLAFGLGLYNLWEFAWFPELDAGDELIDALDALILYGTPFLEAVGLTLLLVAAFVGRREPHAGAFYDQH